MGAGEPVDRDEGALGIELLHHDAGRAEMDRGGEEPVGRAVVERRGGEIDRGGAETESRRKRGVAVVDVIEAALERRLAHALRSARRAR
jgi:hypothetical protein